MKRVLYIFIYIVLLLCGCHDDYWDLGDSYVYDNGYVYLQVDKHYKNHKYYEELVPYRVLNFGYDENYIIAYQEPDSAQYRRFSIDIYKDFPDSIKQSQVKIDSLESMLDSMLSIKDCYWIICKKDTKVYGPMTKSDFNRKCKKMKINLKWIRDMNNKISNKTRDK